MEITNRQNAARLEFDARVRRFEEDKARWREAFDDLRNARLQRRRLGDSPFDRLQARLDTMPVIEQAKGILMAQYRCPPEEAFDLLRRASQRANIKVSALAAQIVEQTGSPDARRDGKTRIANLVPFRRQLAARDR